MKALFESIKNHKKAFIISLIFLVYFASGLIRCIANGDGLSKVRFAIYLMLIGLTVTFFIFSCVFEKVRYDIAALLIILCFGIISLIIMPLYTVPDEQVHMYGAYRVSNKLMGKEAESPYKAVMMRNDDRMDAYYPGSYTVLAIVNYWSWLDKDASDETFVDSGHPAPNAPEYCYFFSALGITIGRLLHLGPMKVYFLGRIFNLVFFAVISFFAIQIIPKGKPVLFVLSTMPICIQQAASLSYDSFLIPMAFLLTAFTVKYIVDGTLSRVPFILMFVTALLVLPMKGWAYFPIALLPFFIVLWRNRKNIIKKDKIRHIIYALLFALFVIAVFAALFYFRKQPDNNYHETLGMYGYSIPYLAKHLSAFPRLLANALEASTAWYFDTFFGGLLGRLEININQIFRLIYLILLILAIMHRKSDEYYFSIKAKSGFFVVALISVLCIFAGMLVGWTGLESDVIQGVQGRYFIPLAFYIMMLFNTKRVECSENIDRVLLFLDLWSLGFVELDVIGMLG